MILPNVIENLVKTQNNFDSLAYANCFSETAVVFDEGNTYNGKIEIQKWIEKVNNDYKVAMKPLEYSPTEEILIAEVSGSFPGSPVILTYRLKLHKGLIQSLTITE
jgi:hypothetical protein